MNSFRTKRIFEAPAEKDGYRVLVDRVWPRGVSKTKAALDEWARDLGPSTELRKWFGHDPKRWDEFRRRYRAELEVREDDLTRLRQHARRGRVTLLYSARDETRNQAAVIREVLDEG